MSDDTPDARERAEAEALARALDGKPSPDAPADALEVAALLRHARERPDPGRLAQVRERALTAPVRRLSRPRVVAGLAAFSAAAVVALGFMATRDAPESAPAAQVVAASTPPRGSSLRALLDAQAEALRTPEAPLAGLAEATAPRRRELLASLEERYGGGQP